MQDFGYEHIETARSATEAREKLAEPFDVIVADMRMEQDDSGFAIVDEVQQRNLSSVVIIFTANDTVADCRRAFKMGAWDYISKNMRGNAFEALHESIQEAIAYFNRWGNTQNDRWIAEHMDELQEHYTGQYIAVMNMAVIDAADSLDALERRIAERKLRRFLTKIKQIGRRRPITDLIALGESATLEFKSTFQWDVRQDKQRKDLRFEVLKTIAAFLNSEGGTLLIGVQDDGTIFGLERDLALLSNSLDKFERAIMDPIRELIGKPFTQFVKTYPEHVGDKQIYVVEVRKASRPAFLTENNKRWLYVRSGNASILLDAAETLEYVMMKM